MAWVARQATMQDTADALSPPDGTAQAAGLPSARSGQDEGRVCIFLAALQAGVLAEPRLRQRLPHTRHQRPAHMRGAGGSACPFNLQVGTQLRVKPASQPASQPHEMHPPVGDGLPRVLLRVCCDDGSDAVAQRTVPAGQAGKWHASLVGRCVRGDDYKCGETMRQRNTARQPAPSTARGPRLQRLVATAGNAMQSSVA